MALLRRSIAALLLAGLAAAPALAADPFVTVKPPAEGPANSAFWILDMESRPDGSSVAGLPLAQLNNAQGRAGPRWCAADPLTAASFASTDPAVSAEIRQYLGGPDGNIFRATTRMTGAPVLALVGNYRTCNGEAAPFLLLVDQSQRRPRVVYIRSFPDWTPFIALRADGNRLVVSSCLECDHAEILSYNRRTRRFSWRSAGP
ncbi:MAG TPA: hypothetical protein VEC11_09080 [Allosphingosinicella sp.]|nr:hypothetical protein [Allosphingosinicella sp.]